MTNKAKFFILYMLLAATGLYIWLHEDSPVPIRRQLAEFPVRHQGWEMISQTSFNERVLKVLRPTDYLSRNYRNGRGEVVEVYIGYHSGGKDSGQIHSPKQCLPGGGWYKLKEDRMLADVPYGRIDLVSAVYEKGDNKDLFLYWYEVRGKSISNEYVLKVTEISNSILHGRRDSAFIRVSVPFEADGDRAFSTGMDFIRDFYPVIKDFLPA